MKETLEQFFLVFIPVFVAIDAIGITPLFMSLTEGIEGHQKKKLVTEATITALVVSVLFVFTGRTIFEFMGISSSDFRIAGGIILLILAIMNLLFNQQDKRRAPQEGDSDAGSKAESIGVVPVGIPLIMGPATLTTILVLVKTHGYFLTITALLLNLAIVWFVFQYSKYIVKVIGASGARAMAKVAALFLAAIAVMMIRVGVQELIGV